MSKKHINLTFISFACLLLAGSYSSAAVAQTVAEEDGIELKTIEVNQNDWADESRSYNIQSDNDTAGVPQPNRDTPQSISSITQKQIKQQKLTTLDKVLQQSAGVSNQSEGIYGRYRSRGFLISKVLVNGLESGLLNGFNEMRPQSSAIYEAVSVLRGPAGLMNGVGDPGGAVMLTRKMPQSRSLTELELRAGSWHSYGATVDIARPLNQANTVRARLVAEAEYAKTWMRWGKERNYNLYGVIDFKPSEASKFYLGFQHRNAHTNALDNTEIVPYDKDGKRRLPVDYRDNAAAEWSRGNPINNNIFIGVEQQLGTTWQLKAEYNYNRIKHDSLRGSAFRWNSDYEGDEMDFSRYERNSTVTAHGFKVTANGSYKLFGRQHQLALGLNLSKTGDIMSDYGADDIRIPISTWRQDRGNSYKPEFDETSNSYEKHRQTIAYVSTKFWFSDRFSTTLGTNFIDYSYKGNYFTESSIDKRVFTPYAAVMFDITPELSAYASYTTIFNPTDARGEDGSVLQPTEGNSIELGLKGELADSSLYYYGAIFSAKQNKVVEVLTDANGELRQFPGTDEYMYKSVDGVRTKGLDIGLSGEILPNWSVNAGYTYTVTKDADGKKVTDEFEPQHMVKLFTSYRYRNWTLGGGINWSSKRTSFYCGTETALVCELTSQKAYALVDAFAAYQINDRSSVALNVSNLFDKRYILNYQGSSYGEPRRVTVSYNYKF